MLPAALGSNILYENIKYERHLNSGAWQENVSTLKCSILDTSTITLKILLKWKTMVTHKIKVLNIK